MAKTVENIFLMDNKLGYRYGFFMWLSFFLPSVVVLFLEPDVVGEPRDFLVNVNVCCCFSLLYFSYFFWSGVPASTPSVHVLTSETAVRLLLLSYYGLDQVTRSDASETGAIGSWNWIQVIAGCVFGVVKVLQNVWILWNRREYMAYEEAQKEHMH